MLIPSKDYLTCEMFPSLSRRVNANSQHNKPPKIGYFKLIKKGEC